MSFEMTLIASSYAMLIWSWQFLCLLVVTWIGVKVNQSMTAASRYRLWLAGLSLCAFLPLATFIASRFPPVLSAAQPLRIVTKITRPEFGELVLPEDTPPVVAADMSTDIIQTPLGKPFVNSTRLWLLGAALWAAGFLSGLARLGTAFWKTRGLRKRAQLQEAPIHANVRLGYSTEVGGPMLVGLWHPLILLPAGIESWTTEPQRTAIVQHELAHWERRDPVVNLLQGVFGAMFFFHPMVRFALRQLSLERELACDDRVLESGTDASVYAEAILQTAEKAILRRQNPLSALHSSRWILEKRMRLILTPTRPRGPRAKRVFRMAGAMSVIVLLVAVSGLMAFQIAQTPAIMPNFQSMGAIDVPNFPPSYDLHIKPTATSSSPESNSSTGPGFWFRHGTGLREVLAEIYEVQPSHIDLPMAMDGSTRYDMDLVLPTEESDETIHRLVRRGIEKELHVRMAMEPRNMDVYVLTALDTLAAHERPVSDGGLDGGSVGTVGLMGGSVTISGFLADLSNPERAEENRLRQLASGVRGKVKPVRSVSSDGSIADFARLLESNLDLLVIDESHLDKTYDLKLSTGSRNSNATLAEMLKDQLGLVLTPARRDVQILAVRAVDSSSTIPLTEVGPLGARGTARSMPPPRGVCRRLDEAIDQYTAERRIAPKSMQDLVDAGYLPDVSSVEPCQIAREVPSAPPTQVHLEDVHVTGLDAYGVSLVSPSSPDFDARMNVAAPGWAHVVQPVKPYVVLVSNKSMRKVVAYALEWTMIGANGRSENSGKIQLKDPDAIAGDFNTGHSIAIPPGKERLAASDFQVSDYEPFVDETMGQWIQNMLRSYANVRKVDVQLLAVIFDDGVLVGSDTQDRMSLSSQFASYVKSEQDVYRSLAERIDKGTSVDEALKAVRQTIPEDPFSMADNNPYPSMAMTQAEVLRKKYGDTQFRAILRRAILKEPFVVRR